MTSTFATATTAHVCELIAGPPGLRVSLYLPVPGDPGFDEQRAFPASYRAAVNDVAQRMATLGVAAPKAADAVRRLEALDLELGALHPSTRGIAVLLGPGGLRQLAMTRPVEASVHVGRTFHLRPLLASAHLDLAYRVVSLTTNRVELFDGDAWGLVRIEGERVPGSLVEALGSELSEGSLQFHKGEAGHNGLIYHGHGGASRARGEDRERFHRVLAGALKKTWSARTDPIVLVAGQAHDGRFRSVAQLPGLLEEGVAQNPKGWSDAELHEHAFGVVQRWLEERDRNALEEARAAVARGRATDALACAAEAAAAGSVAQVFVAPDARVPVHVDAASGALLDSLGDEDALAELCALVLQRGGSAAVSDALEGRDAPLVARFRG
jgi:hypothetical protein